MKKLFSFFSKNLLFIATIFLLAFIPLYPKLPLIDIQNTWVYIRAEDFVVLLVLSIWVAFLLNKKITLKTPLTIPILSFWVAGAVATIHGIILIFPTAANVFPNVAFLNFLRHIEYLSVFFVAYSAMKEKSYLKIVIVVLIATLLGVVFYGFGQKYLEFPAYLTMNEEFAKGIPIKLSQLSRIPSTFAGHYDLAAYLVLLIPIISSLIFGFRNWFLKIFLAGSAFLGFILLFMTVSRVSFFVVIISLILVLFFHKRRFVFFSIPLFAIFAVLFVLFQPSLLERFGNTVSEANVLVDADTGESIGHVRYVTPDYFKDKTIRFQRVRDKEELAKTLGGDVDETYKATPSALLRDDFFPEKIPLVMDTNISTGENLPQGTGYINLSLSPVEQRFGNFYYELTPKGENATRSAEVVIIFGDYLVKKVAAYDLSFTTRFQGEWPNALKAFERNIFLGSGYGSISLAIDNNYLRILGETGLLGTFAFVSIFIALGIFIKKTLPFVEDKLTRSFILGFSAGVIGLALNATLIDVFEASKIAFVLWILVGIVVGILSFYKKQSFNALKELFKASTSSYAILFYIFALVVVVFTPMLDNYFVGDDFTWFRWAADCSIANDCSNTLSRILHYFTDSGGFFYRPGTKIYFLLMYKLFWLNQVVFHTVSIFLHFGVIALFFLLAKKILKNTGLAALGSFLFAIMSGYSEIVFWTSATGHLFNALFALIAIHMFILYEKTRKVFFYILCIFSILFSVLFHEMGVIIPLLIILYKYITDNKFNFRELYKKFEFPLLFSPVLAYIVLRFFANSHWSGGDYNYNLIKLPFNFIGNIFGYLLLTILGPMSLSITGNIRELLKNNFLVSGIGLVVIVVFIYFVFKYLYKKINLEDRKVIIFGLFFFVISLLPFLGLGNITSRYSYLATFGIVILIVFGIKKLYDYLLFYGREIAVGSIVVIVSTFALFHIIQVQQLHKDWNTAGNKVQRFFITLDSIYSNSWSGNDRELHFVNVPIKHGDAWVFPVGLEDAVWLAFKNSDLKVYKHENLKKALDVTGYDFKKWILVFQDDGGVKEIIRKKDSLPIISQ